MSLLMDALRKAEDAKRQADAHGAPHPAPDAVEPTLEPLTANAAAAATRLPDLAEHSAALDAGLAAVAGESDATRTTSNDADPAARSTARNVFAAKAAPPHRSALPLIAALAVLAALGIGTYFWWQLRALSSPPAAPAVRAPAPGPARAVAPEMPPPASPVPELPAAAPVVAPPPMPSPSASAPAASPTAPAAPPAIKAAPARQPVARPRAPLPEDAGEAALHLDRTHPAAASAVERAFDELQSGRLDEAQRGYEQVLRRDAHNADALLGLATIAARQGRNDVAQAYYLRALEADPGNPTAQAGLINARAQNDAGTAESRLKLALDAQPESAALLCALGNLYARQARWSEAQQAYFRAYAAEPDNADIIFNLAVALDHLHQNKLAAQYYQMALGAAQDAGGAALFDRQQARARLQELPR